MSLQALEQFFFRLKSDPEVKVRFIADQRAYLERLDLTAEERGAVLGHDLVGLYRMGVHPLLLFPFARAINVSVPDYRRILSPLAGERMFRS